jgi:hypothetical protein
VSGIRGSDRYEPMYEQLKDLNVLEEAIRSVNTHIEDLGDSCPDIVWFLYQDIVTGRGFLSTTFPCLAKAYSR